MRPRRLIIEMLVAALMTVEMHPLVDVKRNIYNCVVALEPQLFISETTPWTFDKYMTHPATFATHADFDRVDFNLGDPFLACELAALTGVEDLQDSACFLGRAFECPKTEAGDLGVLHFSTASSIRRVSSSTSLDQRNFSALWRAAQLICSTASALRSPTSRKACASPSTTSRRLA